MKTEILALFFLLLLSSTPSIIKGEGSESCTVTPVNTTQTPPTQQTVPTISSGSDEEKDNNKGKKDDKDEEDDMENGDDEEKDSINKVIDEEMDKTGRKKRLGQKGPTSPAGGETPSTEPGGASASTSPPPKGSSSFPWFFHKDSEGASIPVFGLPAATASGPTM